MQKKEKIRSSYFESGKIVIYREIHLIIKQIHLTKKLNINTKIKILKKIIKHWYQQIW